jgi:tryptophanyl-tRNA synthetase
MLDNNEEIEKKIKKALTDNLNIVHFDKSNQPGISNLMSIYQGITGLSYEQIEKKYKNSANYKEFKLDLISLLQKVCGK